MTFSAAPGQADALSCNMPGIPLDDSNLVIKVCIACTSITILFGQHPVIIHQACHYNKQGDMLSVAPQLHVHLQALKLFRRHTGSSQCFQVHLEKKVPHGTHCMHAKHQHSGLLQCCYCKCMQYSSTPVEQCSFVCTACSIQHTNMLQYHVLQYQVPGSLSILTLVLLVGH